MTNKNIINKINKKINKKNYNIYDWNWDLLEKHISLNKYANNYYLDEFIKEKFKIHDRYKELEDFIDD
jgi:hypothetical protein